MFDHAPFELLLLAVDAEDAVTLEACNPCFCQASGVDAGHAVGRLLEAALGAAGTALAQDCRACVQAGTVERTQTLGFPSGERVLRCHYRLLPDEPDGLHRVLLTQTDLSESRRVESALRQTMRLEAVGQLTGGVAHEFNNLLTTVLGSLDLLGRRLVDERQLRWVENATHAAQRGATLTTQLLAYARKQFLAPSATDIPAAVTSMMALLRGSLGVRIALHTDFDPATWPATADPAQLELSLVNLLVNARDAMPAGGTVTLSTVNCPAGHADVPVDLNRGDYVLLTVSDTGTGMAADVLAHAMEPFFTTKPFGQGSGLGLSQSYGVARQLGGTIRLRSAPGQGTTAHIFLPRAAGPAADILPILLVDDDEAVRSIAGALLREEGWDVHEAASGPEALHKLAIKPFGALLADLAMPGMSGLELAGAARLQQPGLPVVFLTGNTDPAVLRSLHAPVLHKPYSVDALLGMVRAAVGNNEAGWEPPVP